LITRPDVDVVSASSSKSVVEMFVKLMIAMLASYA
jgi:hypothetical protein